VKGAVEFVVARTGCPAATWACCAYVRTTNAADDRNETMRTMLREYLPRMHADVPVREWSQV
jgi:hypothetical protein